MPKILIVDDEAYISTQLEERLTFIGYDVVGKASSGEAAIDMARSLDPDLVLMDIVMPGRLDGIDAAEIIKEKQDIPVIFLTAYTENDLIQRAKHVEPFGYIVKPFQESEIKAAIEVALHRKKVERQVRASEEKMRLLIESSPIGISIVKHGKLLYANPEFVSMFEYETTDEIADLPIEMFVVPEDREMVKQRYMKRLSGKQVPSSYEIRGLKKTGELFDMAVRLQLTDYHGEPAILGFVMDVSKEKTLIERLIQAEKIEAMVTLADGIAHDFNNLLMCIQGNASLMLSETDTSHPHYERLKNIVQSVHRGADLTGQILGFAMGGKYEVRLTDMNELVKKTSMMFERTKKEIKIHREYEKDAWMVEVDQGQIEQVLLSLYVNAWQAMPGGGDLYLQTENITLDEDYVKPPGLGPGKYVKISITDTGVGMDEVTKKRIFDPFFTTKEMGKGTGLGLASVYGIIKNHSGIINVYSEKGQGTTFNIYLPASQKGVIKENEIPEEVLKGTETVLLVDDAEIVLDVGEQMLEKMGYKVLVARSGKEAIEVVSKAHRAKSEEQEGKERYAPSAMSPAPDLVILDMIMPEMDGGETFDRMKEINPGMKVLLSSGYSISGQATEILERGCDGFVQKPFTMRQLSQRIREILDKDKIEESQKTAL